MFVESGELLTPAFKRAIYDNPLLQNFETNKELLESLKNSNDGNSQEIERRERELVGLKISLNVGTQKVGRFITSQALLAKLIDKNKNDINIDFFDKEKIEAFFNSMSLTFVDLYLSTDCYEGVLTYIRPTRYIEAMPVPPLMIKVMYILKNNVLTFSTVHVRTVIRAVSLSFIHPHISSITNGNVKICLGNFIDVLSENSASVVISGYQDHVVMIENLLSTYNSDSPYISLNELSLSMLTTDVFHCSPHKIQASGFSILGKRIEDHIVNRSIGYPYNIKVIELIGLDELVKWEEAVKKNTYSSILEETLLGISFLDHDGDDYEMLQSLTSYRKKLITVFGEGLDNPNEYSYFEDGEDGDDEESDTNLQRISEDSFNDVLEQWTRYLKGRGQGVFNIKVAEFRIFITEEVSNVLN
jgi:hypothetical protein